MERGRVPVKLLAAHVPGLWLCWWAAGLLSIPPVQLLFSTLESTASGVIDMDMEVAKDDGGNFCSIHIVCSAVSQEQGWIKSLKEGQNRMTF